MRNPRENSFIILFDLLVDLGKAYKKGVVLLFSQQERKTIPLNNTALNLFHLLITQ